MTFLEAVVIIARSPYLYLCDDPLERSGGLPFCVYDTRQESGFAPGHLSWPAPERDVVEGDLRAVLQVEKERMDSEGVCVISGLDRAD